MEARFRRLAERIQSSLKADSQMHWQRTPPKPIIGPGNLNRSCTISKAVCSSGERSQNPVVKSQVADTDSAVDTHKYGDLTKFCERVDRIETDSSTSSLSTSTSNSSALLQAAAAADEEVEIAADELARPGCLQPRYELPDSVRTQATIIKRSAVPDNGIFPPVQYIESLNSLSNMVHGFSTMSEGSKSYVNPKRLTLADSGSTPAAPVKDFDRCPLCRQRITPVQKKQATTLTSPTLEPEPVKPTPVTTTTTMRTSPKGHDSLPFCLPPIDRMSGHVQVLAKSDDTEQSPWLPNNARGAGQPPPTAPPAAPPPPLRTYLTSTPPPSASQVSFAEWQARHQPMTSPQQTLSFASCQQPRAPPQRYGGSFVSPMNSAISASVMTAPSQVSMSSSVPRLLHAQYIRQTTPPPRRKHARVTTWQEPRSVSPMPRLTRLSESRKVSSSTSSTVAPRDSVPPRISWQFNPSPLINRNSQDPMIPTPSLDVRYAFSPQVVNPSPLANGGAHYYQFPNHRR